MPLRENHNGSSRKESSATEVFRGHNVLVTGGLGFIGSNLAMALVDRGASVTVLDSLIPQFGGSMANIRPVRDRLVVNISDLRDVDSLNVLVQEKDYVFHLAGQVSHGDSMRDPDLDLAVNCVATMNLLEACRKNNPSGRLVYTSTRQVYGRPSKLPVDESHPTLPIDVNGINKLAAEYYHRLYDSVYGLRSTVLRLTNTYGPRQRLNTDRQGVTAVFIRQALQGGTLTLFGGGQRRDFNYVDDVVEAILLAAACENGRGQVFNLGADRPHSLVDFVDVLRKHCRFDIRRIDFPADQKTIDIGDYYGDDSRFRNATGWKPTIDLDEGLRRTVEFYREHRSDYW